MTDPGQHILPGADFTRDVPLPPQPPLEDERTHGCTHCCQMPACGMEGDDCPFISKSAPSCSKSGSNGPPEVCSCRTVAPSGWDTVQQVVDPKCILHGEPGSSEDEVIPKAAAEAIAKALHGRDGFWPWETEEPDVQQDYIHTAGKFLQLTLPHLRPLFTTATRVGYELGRSEAGAEAEERLTELAHRISPNAGNPTLGLGTIIRHLREVTKGDPNG